MSRLTRPRRNQPSILLFFSVIMILGAIIWFIFELVGFTQREDRLPAGITVAGLAVGNMTEIEAQSRIEEAYSTPITLYYQDSPINLNPDAIGFVLNTPVMLASARAEGEAGSGFWGRFLFYLLGREESVVDEVPILSDYQRNALREQLQEIARIYDRSSGTADYNLTTLTVESGATGFILDIDAAMDEVANALNRPDNRAVDLPIIGGATATTSLDVLEEMILAFLDAEGFIYDGQSSVVGIFILDLTTGEEINIQGDVAFSAASTNKVPIMIDLYRTLNREPNQDEAFIMANSLLCSANSSSNRILELFLGNGNIFSGIASVTNTVQYIGAENTFLTAPFVEGVVGQELGSIAAPETNPNPNFNTFADTYNQTTAEDMGTLFSLIYDCANYGSGLMSVYPNEEFTPNECRQMLELTSANDLQRLLQAGLPTGIRISHKNGWIPGQLAGAQGATVGDAGIVFPPNGRDYVISVYLWEETDGTGFNRWHLIEEISRATWNYFNPENPLSTERSDLPPAAQECFSQDSSGTITSYNYLPPYGAVDLDNINGWRDGSPTTPQPLPGEQ
ncbi:MAG: serine hydrolase [Anaerolineae bacterium]|nr:serine hydrolase [Anaerolineae bacterium]